MKLSAIVLSKGEESTQKAIDSVQFADEVILVVDPSATLKVQTAKKVTLVKHELAGDFSQQRNFGSTLASGIWLLFLDSDEIVTKELAEEISKTISDDHAKTAYYIKRHDYFWSKEIKYGETAKARSIGFIRLLKKNSGTWKGTVHEQFITNEPTGILKGVVNHYPHPTISDFLNSINEYSTLRAKELRNNNVRFSLIKMIVYPFGKFIYTYFVRGGILDGAAGFVYSFMMSFHSFLVRAKLLNL
ncbi:MAG: glycosyltransferase family 2 protein [Microgenomates group bacterium]